MTGYDRCYYHARSPMGIDDFVVPDITDPTARSKALTEIFNGLTTNKLDTKRASAMFYAIQIASDRLR